MHYGWTIVGFTFATQFIANGLGFYAFGVLLPAIAEDLDVSRGAASMIPFSMSMAGVVIGPLVGRAVTTIPIHRIVVAGALAMSLAFYAMSHATAIWQLQLGYVLGISLGMSTLGTVVAATLIVNWFEERRVLALGVAGLGISLGGVVMARLTADWVEAYGWQGTYELFALIVLCVAPLAWWRATTRPSDRGLLPYGATLESTSAAGPPPPAIGTMDALRNPNLWWIAMSAGVCFMGGSALTAHGVALAIDAGYPLAQASLVLSAIAASAAAAKLLFSWLAGRIGERASIAVAAMTMAVGSLGIAELGGSFAWLIASAAMLGFGMGGVMPIQAALLARAFGAANFGPVMGLSGPILIVFQSTGAPIFGWVYDSQGDYQLALYGFAAACVLPVLFMTRVRLPDSDAPAPVGDRLPS
jgi:MFS family permease